MAAVYLGVRVVRGEDWTSSEEDGGVGGVGTVVELHWDADGADEPEPSRVTVFWDAGLSGRYRCGADGLFELRLMDPAPAGFPHTNTTCYECSDLIEHGIRWVCQVCSAAELCSRCYIGCRHDLDHCFWALAYPDAERLPVGPRNGSRRVRSKGMYGSAVVCPGLHWPHGVQAGSGVVSRVAHAQDRCGNCIVKVEWNNGSTGEYRLGHQGKVDLKCTKPVNGKYYYSEHLPKLGGKRQGRSTASSGASTAAESTTVPRMTLQASGTRTGPPPAAGNSRGARNHSGSSSSTTGPDATIESSERTNHLPPPMAPKSDSGLSDAGVGSSLSPATAPVSSHTPAPSTTLTPVPMTSPQTLHDHDKKSSSTPVMKETPVLATATATAAASPASHSERPMLSQSGTTSSTPKLHGSDFPPSVVTPQSSVSDVADTPPSSAKVTERSPPSSSTYHSTTKPPFADDANSGQPKSNMSHSAAATGSSSSVAAYDFPSGIVVDGLAQVADIELDIFKAVQESVQSWEDDMITIISQVGEVQQVYDDGQARLFYPKSGTTYTLHSVVLSAIHRFKPDSSVILTTDKSGLRCMMEAIGHWDRQLEEHMGTLGTVVTQLDDYNVYVTFGNSKYLMHPGCLVSSHLGSDFVGRGTPPNTAPSYVASPAASSMATSQTGLSDVNVSLSPMSAERTATPAAKQERGSQEKTGSLVSDNATAGQDKAESHRHIQSPRSPLMSSTGTSPHHISFGDLSPTLLALAFAVTTGDVPAAKAAVANVDRSEINTHITERQLTPLHFAVACDSPDLIELIHRQGGDLEARSTNGYTPIFMAADHNFPSSVERLVKLGAKVDLFSAQGYSPLHVACGTNSCRSARILVELGAEVDIKDPLGDTPLHIAISYDHASCVQAMLAANADFMLVSSDKFPAILQAAFKGSSNALRVLLRCQPASVNYTRGDGTTALHIACINNFGLCVGVLLELPNCDINLRNVADGLSPLTMAVSRGSRSCIEQLVKIGADVMSTNEVGFTALHIAVEKFSKALDPHSGLRLETRSDPPGLGVDIAEIQSTLSFQNESANRMAAIALYLVDHGSSCEYLNNYGFTALDATMNFKLQGLLKERHRRASSVPAVVRTAPKSVSKDNMASTTSNPPRDEPDNSELVASPSHQSAMPVGSSTAEELHVPSAKAAVSPPQKLEAPELCAAEASTTSASSESARVVVAKVKDEMGTEKSAEPIVKSDPVNVIEPHTAKGFQAESTQASNAFPQRSVKVGMLQNEAVADGQSAPQLTAVEAQSVAIGKSSQMTAEESPLSLTPSTGHSLQVSTHLPQDNSQPSPATPAGIRCVPGDMPDTNPGETSSNSAQEDSGQYSKAESQSSSKEDSASTSLGQCQASGTDSKLFTPHGTTPKSKAKTPSTSPVSKKCCADGCTAMATLVFQPCGHLNTCSGCRSKFVRCFHCGRQVLDVIAVDVTQLNKPSTSRAQRAHAVSRVSRKGSSAMKMACKFPARTRSDESSAANTPLTTRSLSLSATAVTNFTESDSSGAERRVLGHETLKLGAVPTPSFACDSVSVVAKSPSHHTSQDSHGNDPVGLGDAANSGQEAPKKTAANGNYSAKPSDVSATEDERPLPANVRTKAKESVVLSSPALNQLSVKKQMQPQVAATKDSGVSSAGERDTDPDVIVYNVPPVQKKSQTMAAKGGNMLDSNLHLNLGASFDALPMKPEHFLTMSSDEQVLSLSSEDRAAGINLAHAVNESAMDVAASILATNPTCVNNSVTTGGWTCMHIAASVGQKEFVELLHQHGGGMNALDKDVLTPAHLAANRNHFECLETIASLGADINLVNKNALSPLHVASYKGFHECVEILLRHGAVLNLKDDNGRTPLVAAISESQSHVVRLLLEAGADPLETTFNGWNALHEATGRESLEIVEILLDCHPNLLNATSVEGGTAMHIAARHNCFYNMQHLLQRPGCDLEVRDATGLPPVMVAATHGNKAAMELLMTAGASVKCENMEGNTALHLVLANHSVAAEMSSCNTFDEEDLSGRGPSPLIDEIQSKMTSSSEKDNRVLAMACYLAQHGADLEYLNHNGVSPLDYCNVPGIEGLLRSHSARKTKTHKTSPAQFPGGGNVVGEIRGEKPNRRSTGKASMPASSPDVSRTSRRGSPSAAQASPRPPKRVAAVSADSSFSVTSSDDTSSDAPLARSGKSRVVTTRSQSQLSVSGSLHSEESDGGGTSVMVCGNREGRLRSTRSVSSVETPSRPGPPGHGQQGPFTPGPSRVSPSLAVVPDESRERVDSSAAGFDRDRYTSTATQAVSQNSGGDTSRHTGGDRPSSFNVQLEDGGQARFAKSMSTTSGASLLSTRSVSSDGIPAGGRPDNSKDKSVETDDDDSDCCCLCDNVVNTVLKPCGHAVLCKVCSQVAKKCPQCKIYIKERLVRM